MRPQLNELVYKVLVSTVNVVNSRNLGRTVGNKTSDGKRGTAAQKGRPPASHR